MTFDADVAAKAAIIVIWFAFVFVVERIRPKTPAPKSRRRLVSNGALWLIVLFVSPAIVLPLTAFAANHALWVRDGAFGQWPLVLVDIVILDCWTYWAHRAYHRVPLMWRLHAAHHLDEFLDSTSAVRFHAFEVTLSALLRMTPIVLLSIPFSHVVVFETTLLAATIFHHSNISLPPRLERALSFIIVTPSIHWVHHHARWRDTNSNYSGVFSIWDRLFRTRSATPRTTDMNIGIEGFTDRTLLALLVMPFTGAGRPHFDGSGTRSEYPISDPQSDAPNAGS